MLPINDIINFIRGLFQKSSSDTLPKEVAHPLANTPEEIFVASLDLLNSRKWSYLVVHQSEDTDSPTNSDFERIKDYHVNEKKWNDIAYHIVIERVNNNLIYRAGRGLSQIGAHAIGYNKSGLGICIVGNFDKAQMDNEEYEFLKKLLKVLMNEFNINSDHVIGHRETFTMPGGSIEELNHKFCPGKLLDLDKLRSEL